MSKMDIFVVNEHPSNLINFKKNAYLFMEYNHDNFIYEIDKNKIALKINAIIEWFGNKSSYNFISDHEGNVKKKINMIFIGSPKNIKAFEIDIEKKSFELNITLLKKKYNIDFTSQICDEGTYRWLSTTHEVQHLDFLKKIRDAASSINIFNNMKYNKDFFDGKIKKILIDNSATNYAFKKGYNIILANIQKPVYHFERTEEVFLPSNNKLIKINFISNFNISNPIHAIIGKNGSGKSYHLKEFLKSYFKNLGQIILNSSSIFSRIILISNTVDDRGYTPSSICRNRNNRSNYHFISNTSLKHYNTIYNQGNKITLNDCIKNIIYREISRSGVFNKALIADEIISILNLEVDILVKCNNQISLTHSIYDALAFFEKEKNFDNLIGLGDIDLDIIFRSGSEKTTLSSGQNTFLIKSLSILMTIETNSLVIIEEPENFLHPSLLINLMSILKQILVQTNSCSIISTHSPLILRELPREQVTIFNRYNNVTSHRKPTIETFGADATELFQEAFSDLEASASYRDSISSMAKSENSVESLLIKYSHLPSTLLTKIINEWKRK